MDAETEFILLEHRVREDFKRIGRELSRARGLIRRAERFLAVRRGEACLALGERRSPLQMGGL